MDAESRRSFVSAPSVASSPLISGFSLTGASKLRSSLAMPVATAAAVRTSVASAALPPGLRELVNQISDTRDLGLLVYLHLPALAGSTGYRKLQGGRPHVRDKSSTRLIRTGKNTGVRFEPTYRLDSQRPFNADRVRKVVKDALEEGFEKRAGATLLQGPKYSEQFAKDACRILAAYITQKVKALDFSRYKIATLVTIIEKKFQGSAYVLRALWDKERDGYCSETFRTPTLTANVIVFATYLD